MINKEIYERRKATILDLLKDQDYKPMRFKELCMFLNVPKDERDSFKHMLDEMMQEGTVSFNAAHRYVSAAPQIVTGLFNGNARGFGFVSVDGRADDIFIPQEHTKDAFDGDTVSVHLTREASGTKRCEGEIIAIVARGVTKIVGTYEKNKKYGFVVPDNQKFSKDIFVSKERSKGAMTGQKVVVKIVSYGSRQKNPEGIVTEILGDIDDPRTDVLTVVRAFDIPTDFPDEVMRQTASIPEYVTEEEMKGRKDIRHLMTVTIDGEDAKDLDDAITLEMRGKNYLLGVHIADVSHYVKEGSPLDTEALNRGTSVYLINRVIPMLPKKLSNGICSLNQGQDRLALSCFMEITPKGQIIGHEIAETVICVDHRMTYTTVNKIITHEDQKAREAYGDFSDMFDRMAELSLLLRQKRKSRGGIDFDFPESKIELDDKGYPTKIYPYERNAATKLIEDFMLAANETIAEDFFWQEIPFLYRTHEVPDADRIQKLCQIIGRFGYYIKVGREEIHPKELQKLLGKIEDTPQEAMISRLALRSMKQAKYTTENLGHFGLAVKYYCHFTSPIRRYPDLQIHRIIKEHISGNLDERRQQHYRNILGNVAMSTSTHERRADDAERELVKLKKVEYMSGRIGQKYTGTVSGMTAWGMFVELPNTCEGMVRLEDMEDDFYEYDDREMTITGMSTGKKYHLGDTVRIVVAGTDKLLKTIDFVIDEEQTTEGGR